MTPNMQNLLPGSHKCHRLDCTYVKLSLFFREHESDDLLGRCMFPPVRLASMFPLVLFRSAVINTSMIHSSSCWEHFDTKLDVKANKAVQNCFGDICGME